MYPLVFVIATEHVFLHIKVINGFISRYVFTISFYCECVCVCVCVVPSGTPRRFDVDSTSIICRYVEDQISTNFLVISTYIFDVISLIEKSTSFPCTFFDVLSLIEKATSFSRTVFDVILMVKISTFFPRTFFDVISIFEKSTLFPRTFFIVISLVEKSTLIPLTFFDVILMV